MKSHLLAIEWSQGIEDAWSDVATFVPTFIAFLAVLFVGWIIVRIIARAVRKVLQRVGFNEAVSRGPLDDFLSRSDNDAATIVSKVVYYIGLLLVLQMAFAVFGPNAVSAMIDSIIAFVPKAVVALVIIAVAMVIGGAVRDIITTSLGRLPYGRAAGTGAYVAIMVVAGFAALSHMEIAPDIVNAVFYAMLAVIAGSAIVAIGGGGIQPMRMRWERSLARYDEEKGRMKHEVQAARADAAYRSDIVEGQGEVDMSRSQPRAQAPHGQQTQQYGYTDYSGYEGGAYEGGGYEPR
jgi:hypothetical protein